MPYPILTFQKKIKDQEKTGYYSFHNQEQILYSGLTNATPEVIDFSCKIRPFASNRGYIILNEGSFTQNAFGLYILTNTVWLRDRLTRDIGYNVTALLGQWIDIRCIIYSTSKELYINNNLEASGPAQWQRIQFGIAAGGTGVLGGGAPNFDLRNCDLRCIDINITSTSGQYNCNEESGTTSIDVSGNGNDGVISGIGAEQFFNIDPSLNKCF